MKRVIFLMLFVAVVGCHDSNSVGPVLDNSAQLNRLDDVNGTLGNPLKNGGTKTDVFLCNYNFNPGQCGDVMNGSSLEYVIDNEIKGELIQRYIFNAQIYSPSKMVIDRKSFNTCNIYTINRMEKVTQGGKVLSGETWGTFKIVQYTGTVPNENSVALFEGEFTGNIVLNTTKIKLTGKGQLGYRDRYLSVEEVQHCTSNVGKLQCWTANMKGSLSSRVKYEN